MINILNSSKALVFCSSKDLTSDERDCYKIGGILLNLVQFR